MPPDYLPGSNDEAAAAIDALLNGTEAPEDDAPAAPQAVPAETETPAPNTDEEAAPAETPVASAPVADTTPAPVQAQAPQPVTPAPQVAAAPAPQAPLTAQTQLHQLNQVLPILQGQLAAQFPDIRTLDDLGRVAAEDPGRAVAYQAAERKVQAVQSARDNAQSAYRGEWLQAETAKLHHAIPEMADPVKGPALTARLTSYAKECGYTDQQIQWAAATDVKMLHDAMQFRDSQNAVAAKAKAQADALKTAQAKAADAPPVQKPGAQRSPEVGDKSKESLERFEKTGRVDDLAALLTQSGLA